MRSMILVWNITSIFLHEKLWVAFIEARETNGKFFKKEKKKKLG